MDNYIYYEVWGKTFEGDERWHTGRFPAETTEEEAFEIASNMINSQGGVGGDFATCLRVEWSKEGDWFTVDYC